MGLINDQQRENSQQPKLTVEPLPKQPEATASASEPLELGGGFSSGNEFQLTEPTIPQPEPLPSEQSPALDFSLTDDNVEPQTGFVPENPDNAFIGKPGIWRVLPDEVDPYSPESLATSKPSVYDLNIVGSEAQRVDSLGRSYTGESFAKTSEAQQRAQTEALTQQQKLGNRDANINIPKKDRPWYSGATGYLSDVLFGSKLAQEQAEKKKVFNPVTGQFGLQGAGLGGLVKYTLGLLTQIPAGVLAEGTEGIARSAEAVGISPENAQKFATGGVLAFIPGYEKLQRELGLQIDWKKLYERNAVFDALTAQTKVDDLNDPAGKNQGFFYREKRPIRPELPVFDPNSKTEAIGRFTYGVGQAIVDDPVGAAYEIGFQLFNPFDNIVGDVVSNGIRTLARSGQVPKSAIPPSLPLPDKDYSIKPKQQLALPPGKVQEVPVEQQLEQMMAGKIPDQRVQPQRRLPGTVEVKVQPGQRVLPPARGAYPRNQTQSAIIPYKTPDKVDAEFVEPPPARNRALPESSSSDNFVLGQKLTETEQPKQPTIDLPSEPTGQPKLPPSAEFPALPGTRDVFDAEFADDSVEFGWIADFDIVKAPASRPAKVLRVLTGDVNVIQNSMPPVFPNWVWVNRNIEADIVGTPSEAVFRIGIGTPSSEPIAIADEINIAGVDDIELSNRQKAEAFFKQEAETRRRLIGETTSAPAPAPAAVTEAIAPKAPEVQEFVAPQAPPLSKTQEEVLAKQPEQTVAKPEPGQPKLTTVPQETIDRLLGKPKWDNNDIIEAERVIQVMTKGGDLNFARALLDKRKQQLAKKLERIEPTVPVVAKPPATEAVTYFNPPELRQLSWQKPKLGRGKVIRVNPQELDKLWKFDRIEQSGGGGIGNRYNDAKNFLANTKEKVIMSEIRVNPDGSINFIDGRHRLAVLRDLGYTDVPIVVSNSKRLPDTVLSEGSKIRATSAPAVTELTGRNFQVEDAYNYFKQLIAKDGELLPKKLNEVYAKTVDSSSEGLGKTPSPGLSLVWEAYSLDAPFKGKKDLRWLDELYSKYKSTDVALPPKPQQVPTQNLLEAQRQLAAHKAVIQAPLKQLDNVFDTTVDYGRKITDELPYSKITTDTVASAFRNGSKLNLPPQSFVKIQGSLGKEVTEALFKADYADVFSLASKSSLKMSDIVNVIVRANNSTIDEKVKAIQKLTALPNTIKFPEKMMHGTALKGWNPNYNIRINGSRGELGSGLYVTNRKSVAVDYAKAIISENVSPGANALDIQPSTYDISNSFTATFSARGKLAPNSETVNGLLANLPEEIKSSVKRSLQRDKTTSYVGVLNKIEAAIPKSGLEPTEEVLKDLYGKVSDNLRNMGYDSVYDSKSGFGLILDETKITVGKPNLLPKTQSPLQAALARYNADAYAAKFYNERLTTDANLRDSAYKVLSQLENNVDEKLAKVQQDIISRGLDKQSSVLPPRQTLKAGTSLNDAKPDNLSEVLSEIKPKSNPKDNPCEI